MNKVVCLIHQQTHIHTGPFGVRTQYFHTTVEWDVKPYHTIFQQF